MSTLLTSVGALSLSFGIGHAILSIAVVVLGACGTYMLLPHQHGRLKPGRVHAVGGGLVGLSILLLALFWTPPGGFLTSVFFYVFGITSVAAGVLMVTSRNPVYSALWFAAVVLATSGLFLLSGAQFLAAGTVIVYAGAIIVTFLFVIMLAQSTGQALYDRTARSPAWATFTCYLMLWALLYAMLLVQSPEQGPGHVPQAAEKRLARPGQLVRLYLVDPVSPLGGVIQRANRSTSVMPPAGSSAANVAGLGGALYTDHLIAAELAGVLLFVALVGALAIATPRPPIRPAERTTAA